MQTAHGCAVGAGSPMVPSKPARTTTPNEQDDLQVEARKKRIADAFELLEDVASYERKKFEGDPGTDLNVSGADLVDWFSDIRERADALVKAERESSAGGLK